MQVVYTFGRSVDVDGDEWIDLGPIVPATEQEAAASPSDDDNNPFPPQATAKTRGTTLSDPAATTEPMPEPKPEANIELPRRKNQQKTTQKETSKKTGAKQSAPVMSKAAMSKEALMAFYLGRAKQMEAKHKQIVVAPTQPVGIRSLQEPERSELIGIWTNSPSE
ncbi:hypothetical protein PHYPSEUDO_002343 [Phytophthora pseudosyringae]|uniref:Uncharacterized protein n=1 Tax=Phytophthora pseudosyringae TaxID=221518 RepID=A0A8T1WK89_9STRA|nr:hypothetical protein PHYPSEUDO_002343 [Phytophthora pseudosyringae]